MTGYIGSAWVDAADQESGTFNLVEGQRYAVENGEYNSTVKFTARLIRFRRDGYHVETAWDNGVEIEAYGDLDRFQASPVSDPEAGA